MNFNEDVLVVVDRKSFPLKCGELSDVLSLFNCRIVDAEGETPTAFFRECLSHAENYGLVIPVTRNVYVRDRLRMEGVKTVICL